MACAISELLGNLDGILLSSPDLCDANLLQSYALGIVFISLTIQGSRYEVIFTTYFISAWMGYIS